MECPVCGAALPGGAAGDAHVNAHFEEPSHDVASAATPSHTSCAVCGVLVAAAEVESHAMAHALQASDFAAALRAGGSAGDAIDLCDDDGSDVGAALRGGARRAATPPPRLVLSALPGCATAEPLPAVAEGLHGLIRGALSAQPAHRGFFRAALAGAPLMHYATAEGLDAGWGCGYRNMQMLCAHLLSLRDARSAALFRGAGALPDVRSLQAWVEAAWGAGFDVEGAAQLGGTLQGGRAWVGATECAALLRSFGLRARVVDFRAADAHAQPPRQPQPKRPLSEDAAAAGIEIHTGVECDGCGQCPIRGPRLRSVARASYDLCMRCGASPAAAAFAPYERCAAPSALDGGAMAAAMAAWVWRYFTTDDVSGRPLPPRLGEQVLVSTRPPLFLQHDGHSRTVVGIEKRRATAGAAEETFLLILDPGTPPVELGAALRRKAGWERLLKRGVATLSRKSEYQLVWVEPGVAAPDSAEWKALRVMDSYKGTAEAPVARIASE